MRWWRRTKCHRVNHHLHFRLKITSRQQRFQIFHPTILLSHKNFFFGKILMTSLHVICGLDLPRSKILSTTINWRSPEKNFKDLFFGERLRLCPWSLALASSIAVLGLERFCPPKGCPWPWPRIFFVSLASASSLVSSTPPLIFKFKKSWAQSLYREISCWGRVIGRNSWNRESPDEIGRVYRCDGQSS